MMDLNTFAASLKRSPHTKETYKSNVGRYLAWLNGREPSEETAQEYIDHLEERGRAPNTVANAAHALQAYFKAQRQPISLVHPKIQLSEPRYRTMAEVYRLLQAARTPLERALVEVIFDTACRIGEILKLDTQDIDWDARLVTVTRKGGRREDVNISARALEALGDWLNTRRGKDRRVFMDWDYNDVLKVLKELAKRAGVENFTPHQLRHARAVQMLDAGCSLHDVQRHLGHVNIATTANIYGRLRPMDLKERIPSW